MFRGQRTEVRGQRSEDRGQIFCYLLSVFCLLFSVLCLLSSLCSAQSLTSTELIKNAKQYDDKVVVYEGELIGSVLKRGQFAWLNLNDGENAVGVWVPLAAAQAVRYAGNYKSRGDWIRVSGIFRRACPEHGGGLDIHAQAISVLREGASVSEVLYRKKVFFLFLLLGVLACLLIIHILKMRLSGK
jgi:hypothetical protein